MIPKRRSWIPLALVASLLGACGGGGADGSTTSTAETTSTTQAQATTTTAPTSTTTVTQARTYTGADGFETDVSDVSRIVSLNGDITEILFELGLGANVVAVDVTTTYPDEAAALNETGSTVGFGQQLTPEAVLRFEPTLVIGDTQIAPTETIDQLRQAGIPVVIIETQTTLDGVATKIMEIATIVGVSGDELASRVTSEIDAALALAATSDSEPTAAYVYLRGPQVIFLFGAGMPTQAMIEGAGAIDAGASTGVFGPAPLTPEALVAAAPDVIVLPEAGLAALGGIEAFEAIPGVAGTPAAENDNYLIYDEAYFFNLGPRVGQALMEFVIDLHPEVEG